MRGAVEAAQKRVAAARDSLKAAQDVSRRAALAAEDPPAQVQADTAGSDLPGYQDPTPLLRTITDRKQITMLVPGCQL